MDLTLLTTEQFMRAQHRGDGRRTALVSVSAHNVLAVLRNERLQGNWISSAGVCHGKSAVLFTALPLDVRSSYQ